MHPVFLLIALVVALVYISRYHGAPAAQRKRLRDRALLIGGAVLLALMVLRGGLHPLLALVGGAAALGFRLLQMAQVAGTVRGQFNSWRAAGGQPSKPGRQSEVRTRFVHMTLDHDSGAMSGVVLEGRFKGRQLDELDLPSLRLLHDETAADAQSRAVLDAYLTRVRGEDWSGAESGGAGRSTRTAPSRDEAREILGVGPEADRDEIVGAHRRLMQKFHPDRGGSTYLAAQINDAKRVLLDD